MTKLNKLEAIELDFFENAPLRVVCSIETTASVETIFETLRGDEIWTEWAFALKEVVWTSEKPYGQGSTRDVHMMGGMLIKENFFHWQEGERVAFYVTESNIPGINKFAEDYVIQTVSDKSRRIIWTVAIEPTGIQRYFAPVMAVLTKLALRGWLNKYKKILDTMQ